MSSGATTVFYSRCKPCGVDAIEIARSGPCVFIGYTMAKAGVDKTPGDVRPWMVDVTCSDEDWALHRAAQERRHPQHTQNRNLARRVKPGAIVMVPRPSHGVVYCGRVTIQFRVAYDQARSDRFIELYEAHRGRPLNGGEVNWVQGEVCQGWDVDEFVPIPVPQIPAWIRRSLFGRSTYGVIRADIHAGDPHQVLSALMEAPSFAKRDWTLDPVAVRARLMETVTPDIFEHLVVALLQLEQPELAWLNVGGSGDGGVDGIGVDDSGAVAGLLQCKWSYWGEAVFSAKPQSTPARTYLATLHGSGSAKGADLVLDSAWVVSSILKHHASLPLARTLRIGPSPLAAASDARAA
jgi:hypothetical protein